MSADGEKSDELELNLQGVTTGRWERISPPGVREARQRLHGKTPIVTAEEASALFDDLLYMYPELKLFFNRVQLRSAAQEWLILRFERFKHFYPLERVATITEIDVASKTITISSQPKKETEHGQEKA